MLQSFRALILVTLCLPVSFACSRKDVQSRPHESAISMEQPVLSERQALDVEAQARLRQAEQKAIAKNAGVLKTKVALILQPSVLSDTKRTTSEETRRQLFTLSSEVVVLLDKSEGTKLAPELTGILDLYKQSMLMGCDEYLRGCRTTGFFRQDPSSARIARALAERETDIMKAYTFYRLAYAYKNSSKDEALPLSYLRRAKSYYDELVKRQDDHHALLKKEHLEITTEILTKIQAHPNEPFDTSLLKDFRPWEFSRIRDPELVRIDALALTISTRSALYNQGSNEFSPDFRTQIESLVSDENGFMKKVQELQQRQPWLFRTLGLPETIAADEHFFIFENLYNGRLTVADASHIWSATPMKTTEARVAFENYVKTRLALLIIDGNRTMTSFFRSEGKFSSSSVIFRAIEEGLKVEHMWKDAYKRLDFLKIFAARHLRDNSKTVDSIDLLFAGLQRNVKYMSTYPTMLIMCYHLARLNASISFQTFLGELKLSHTEILGAFFDGRYQPWFNFSGDDAPLNKSELYQVFISILRLGMIQDAGISYRDFFEVLSKGRLAEVQLKVPTFNEVMVESFSKRTQYKDFKQACERIKAGQTVYESGMPLQRLYHHTVYGVPNHMDPMFTDLPLQAAWKFYDTDREKTKWQMHDIVEVSRINYMARLNQMKLFKTLLGIYVRETQGAPAEIKTLEEIDAVLAPYERPIKELYGHFFRLHREIYSCANRMVDLELETQKKLVKVFAQHLREVHAAMTDLQASRTQDLSDRFNLSHVPSLRFPGLALHESGLGFSSTKYRLSLIQVLLRFKQALESGSRPAGSISLPNHSIDEINADLRQRIAEIPYSANADEFVQSGLRHLFARFHGLVDWFNISNVPGAYQRMLKTLVSLYKLGEFEVLHCNENHSSCTKATENITAEELTQVTLDTIRRLQLDADWTQILKEAGRYTRFPEPIYFDDFSHRKSDGAPMGLMDYTFKLVRRSFLEESTPPGLEVIRPLDEAGNYFKSTLRLSVNTFQVPAVYTDALENYHMGLLRNDLGTQIRFMKLARSVDKGSASGRQDLPRWIFSLAHLKNGPVPMLSSYMIQDLRGELVKFKNDTQRPIEREFLPPQSED